MADKKQATEKPEALAAQKLTIGRVVHYVEANGTSEGIHRPAFVNWDYDGKEMVLTVIHPQKVYSRPVKITPQDEADKKPLSWHWPERE